MPNNITQINSIKELKELTATLKARIQIINQLVELDDPVITEERKKMHIYLNNKNYYFAKKAFKKSLDQNNQNFF